MRTERIVRLPDGFEELAADAIADHLVFALLAVGTLLFLTLAALTAVGVIDWQRVNAWWS